MSIAERIYSKRKEQKGMSQKKLADLSGVSFSSIRRYESGEREPRKSDVSKLATALNTSAAYLMHGIDKETVKASFLALKDKEQKDADTVVTRIRHKPDGTEVVEQLRPTRKEKMQEIWEELNAKGQRKTIEYATDLSKADEYRAVPAADAPMESED